MILYLLLYILLSLVVLLALGGLIITTAFAIYLVRWKNGTWDGLHR